MSGEKLFEAYHRYSTCPLPEWNTCITYSNKCSEITCIGADMMDGKVWPWYPWMIDNDMDMAVIPMDSEYNDTYALGCRVDCTNTYILSDTDPQAYPMLWILTTDARIHLFSFISENTHTPSQLLMKHAKSLPSNQQIQQVTEQMEQKSNIVNAAPTLAVTTMSVQTKPIENAPAPVPVAISTAAIAPTQSQPAAATVNPLFPGLPSTGFSFNTTAPSTFFIFLYAVSFLSFIVAFHMISLIRDYYIAFCLIGSNRII